MKNKIIYLSLFCFNSIFANEFIYSHTLENKIFEKLTEEKKERFLELEGYEYNKNKNDKNYKFKIDELNVQTLYYLIVKDLKNVYNYTHNENYIDYSNLFCTEKDKMNKLKLKCMISNLRFENFKFNNSDVNLKIDKMEYEEIKTLINYDYFIFKESEYLMSNEYEYFDRNENKIKEDMPRNYYENVKNLKVNYYLKENLFNYLIRIEKIKINKLTLNNLTLNDLKITNFRSILNLIFNNNLDYYKEEKNLKIEFNLKDMKLNQLNTNFLPEFISKFIKLKLKEKYLNFKFNVDMDIKKENEQIIFNIKSFEMKNKLLEIDSNFIFSFQYKDYLYDKNLLDNIILLNGNIKFNLANFNKEIKTYFKLKNTKKLNYVRVKQNNLDLKLIKNFNEYNNFFDISKIELYRYILPFIRFEKNELNIHIDNKKLLKNIEIYDNLKEAYIHNINFEDAINIEYDFKKDSIIKKKEY